MSIYFLLILIPTIIISYLGFSDYNLIERYKFSVYTIKNGDYKRLVTSGFLHADWSHLLLNMISLYFFNDIVLSRFGGIFFLVIYFGSIVVGNIFSMNVHRKTPYYSAIGASGGVSGIIFAAIALYPHIRVNFIPGWLFGALYFGYSVYMMLNPRQGDNIGHSAHLGGAIFGLAFVTLFSPYSVINNRLYIIAMALPLIYMGYKLIGRK